LRLLSSQKNPDLLWIPKFHSRVHKKGPPLLPVLNQMNPVHNFPLYFPKIHSNIILPSTSSLYEWSLPVRFSKQTNKQTKKTKKKQKKTLYAFIILKRKCMRNICIKFNMIRSSDRIYLFLTSCECVLHIGECLHVYISMSVL